MRILLTGGAGYVGSACLRWLQEHGHEPLAFDNLSEGNAAAVPSDCLVIGDICERRSLVKAMRDYRIEAVMHFAAVASVPDSNRDPDTYWRINVIGTKNVLDAMRECRITRLVFSSTAAVYSFNNPMPLTEASELAPRVTYGTTKLTAERMIEDYNRAYGIAFTHLRYFNAAGADSNGEYGEDRRRESHLIPRVLHTAIGRHKAVQIYGGDWNTPDGTCVRDYIHTEDLAYAHQLVIENMEPGMGRIYNVGFGVGVTVLEVIHACERVIGKTVPYEVVGRRPGDPGILIASSERLRGKLDWKPRYTNIQDIVATAWDWTHKYPQGYNSKT